MIRDDLTRYTSLKKAEHLHDIYRQGDDTPKTREEWQRQMDEDDMGGGAYG